MTFHSAHRHRGPICCENCPPTWIRYLRCHLLGTTSNYTQTHKMRNDEARKSQPYVSIIMAHCQEAQLVGSSSRTPKGCGIDPWSGHIPKLWVRSLVRVPTEGNWSMFLSFSLPLSQINKYILRWGSGKILVGERGKTKHCVITLLSFLNEYLYNLCGFLLSICLMWSP